MKISALPQLRLTQVSASRRFHFGRSLSKHVCRLTFFYDDPF